MGNQLSKVVLRAIGVAYWEISCIILQPEGEHNSSSSPVDPANA